jgi:hypothetical protein
MPVNPASEALHELAVAKMAGDKDVVDQVPLNRES